VKVLFVSSEAYPLAKTGGLGDVSHSLPVALHHAGADVRLVLPAYRSALKTVSNLQILGWLDTGLGQEVRILQAEHPEYPMPVWLIDHPNLFDRSGSPYTHPDGYDWPDNAQRFNQFSHAAALLACDALKTGWRADIVHANDWQTGLVPAYLTFEHNAPKSIFTIHNLAYDCQFDYGTFQAMHLPPHWWSMEHGEFYGRFSMIKAGIVFADHITTVSPRYAEEICTSEYGYGYADILNANKDKLSGIINGIDSNIWDPSTDKLLVANYTVNKSLKSAKQKNRKALLQKLGANDKVLAGKLPLIGFVGRMAFQKGIDLLLDSIEETLSKEKVLFAVIGSGDKELEARLKSIAVKYPEQVFCWIGYSEELAHLLEAGSDMFVMPSRYEPCGLNQLYSLRYGTPPIVRNTGGLADTVTDTNEKTLANHSATGFVFEHADSEDLSRAISRAINTHKQAETWSNIVKNGMQLETGWQQSAADYLQLYGAMTHG